MYCVRWATDVRKGGGCHPSAQLRMPRVFHDSRLYLTLAVLILVWVGTASVPTPVRADVAELGPGAPAPAGGVWLDDAGAERAARDLAQGRKDAAELEAARALLASLEASGTAQASEVVALRDQVAVLEKQVALAAKLDAVRLQVDDIQAKALELAAGSLELQAKLNDAATKTVDLLVRANEQQLKATELANSEIERLRKKGFWDDLRSVLFAVGAFFAGKAF